MTGRYEFTVCASGQQEGAEFELVCYQSAEIRGRRGGVGADLDLGAVVSRVTGGIEDDLLARIHSEIPLPTHLLKSRDTLSLLI